MEFRDFTVEILGEREGRFDVRVASRASGELQAAVTLARAVEELLAVRDIRATATRAASDVERGFTPDVRPGADARAADVGQVLFDMLFSEPETSRALAECMTDARNSQAGVRLKLTLNTRDHAVANLARLPWELLHDESKYKHFGLRPDFPIVRYLEVPKPFALGRFTPPLRILAVSANPRQDLALDRERDNLTAALGANSDIDLTFVERATIQAIAAALTRATMAGKPIHVVHYMGHGDFHDGRGVLLLHKEGGGEDLVEAEAFATALQAAGDVRLVFLNACNTAQSAATAAADPFAGVATSLVFEGVPAVVAMQRPVPDAAAIVLARDFYANIAKGWPVHAAVSEGRRQMFFADRATPDWAIPVLFMRSPDGVLFDRGDLAVPAEATVPAAQRPDARGETLLSRPATTVPLVAPARSSGRWVKLAAGAVAATALLGGAIYLLSGPVDPASMQFLAFEKNAIATGETIQARVRLADKNGTPIQGEALADYAVERVPSQAGAVAITPRPVTPDAVELAAEIRADKPLRPNTAQDLKDTVTQLTAATAAAEKASSLSAATATVPERLAAWDDASIRIEAARPAGPSAAAARKTATELRAIETTQSTVSRLVTCSAAAFRGSECSRAESNFRTGQPVYLQVVFRTPPDMRGTDRLRFERGPVGNDGAFSRTGELVMKEFFEGRTIERNWWGVFTAGPAGNYEIRVKTDRQGTFVWREKVTVS